MLSLDDYEKGEVQCPHCGSEKVEQRWSFSLITPKKSA
jgi:RNA polymerase subunit RPABC4/transcription elongation factor Spt4